jgi:hypothetical protein
MLGAKKGLFSVALSCLVEVGCGGEAVKESIHQGCSGDRVRSMQ